MESINEELASAFHLSPKTIAAIKSHLIEIDNLTIAYPPRVTGKFIYLNLGADGKPAEESLIQLMDDVLPRFCVPHKDRRRYHDLAAAESNPDEREAIYKNLRREARQAIRKISTTGEPGALLLFMVLEALFGAPQIATKVFFKTSPSVEYQGADNIHIKFHKANNSLEILFGEAKLYASVSQSLKDICKSIASYDNPATPSAEKAKDLRIISENASVCSDNDETLRKVLAEYFDIYSPKTFQKIETHVAFSGFNFQYINKALTKGQLTHAAFKLAYEKRIKKAIPLFVERQKQFGLTSLNFIVVLIPFRSVDQFRQRFLTEIQK